MLSRLFQGSIRKKLATLFLFAALPGLIFIAVNGWRDRQQTIAKAEIDLLRFATQMAEIQQQVTLSTKVLLDNLAIMPAIRQADKTACLQIFAHALQSTSHLAAITLTDPAGNVIASTRAQATANLSGNKHFRDALHTKSFAVGEYLIGRLQPVPIFPFATPVLTESGDVQGLLLASIELDRYEQLFREMRFPENSFVGACDHAGIRLFRFPVTSAVAIGQPIRPTVFEAARTATLEGLISDDGSDGIARIIAFRQLRLTPDSEPYAYVFVGMSESEVHAVAREKTLTSLGIFLLAICLTMISGWLFGGKRLGCELEELAAASTRLGQGDLTTRVRTDSEISEIATLSAAFNAMAQSLSDDLEKRKQTEALLRHNEERLALALEATSDGLWDWNLKTQEVYFSPRYATMLGYEHDELKHSFTTWESLLHPDDLEKSKEIVTRHIEQGQPFVLEFRLRNKAGGWQWVMGRGKTVERDAEGRPTRMVGTHVDIHDRKLADIAVHRLTQILENADAIAVMKDTNLCYLAANKAYLRLTGFTSQDMLIGKTDRELFHGLAAEEEIRHYMDNDRKAMSLPPGQVLTVEESLPGPDGEIRTFLTKKFPVYDQDQQALTGVATLSSEITDRKAMEIELRKARDAAEAASSAKSEFLANMSHEIRTPLNGILGMLQLLETSAMNEEQCQFCSLAIQSTNRLTRLLSDILDLSRIEAGKMQLNQTPFNLREIVTQVVDLFVPIAVQSNVALQHHLAPSLPEIVIGDAVRLQQILINLIGNAFKFTDQGHVRLEAYPLPRTKNGRLRIFFSVSDTGQGIADEALSTLFAPFTQAAQGYKRNHQGAGLGLSICKQLVTLMDGDMSVESTVGAGSSFHFCITVDNAGDITIQAQPEETAVSTGGNRRILVAEDDEVTLFSICKLLEKTRYRVEVARNGQEALDLHRSQDFDLILMDVQMPLLDGVEATRRIRELESKDKRDIPIIALTAYAMAGDKERFLAAGMNGYLAKPVGLGDLLKTLEATLPVGNS